MGSEILAKEKKEADVRRSLVTDLNQAMVAATTTAPTTAVAGENASLAVVVAARANATMAIPRTPTTPEHRQ